jgi:hypothetical protein
VDRTFPPEPSAGRPPRPDDPGRRVPPRSDLASPLAPRRPDERRPRPLEWALILTGLGTTVLVAAATVGVLSDRALMGAPSDPRPFTGRIEAPTPIDRKHESSDYTFLRESSGGEPWRWNPCEPIHYVVNIEEAPTNPLADLREAVDRVEEATGLIFTFDGTTDEVPGPFRLAYQPHRYGREWAPILIGWVHPSESAIDFGRGQRMAAGVAAPLVAPARPRHQWVSGWIAINADLPQSRGFWWSGARGITLMHELGHVVGLGHVKVRSEIMHPSAGLATEWGPGDLAGLEQLGRKGGCLNSPDLP